jgi:paraquat-inducible protein B
MNRATIEKSEYSTALPKPKIKERRWPILLIWLAPVFAAIMAGYYVYDLFEDRGMQITLTFSDGSGLKAGQSQVMHLGVEIGQVTDIQLSPDQKHVVVRVHLQRSAAAFAKQGASFWVVRPEISTESISGLGTVLSGPFIDTTAGSGESQTEFTGLEKAPATLEDGLRIVLKAAGLEHLQSGSPVYYRDVQVGVIEDALLSGDAASVDVHAVIRKRYSALVKSNSQFWVVSAVDVKGGLFTGVQMKVESLRSLLSGGIAFATPDKNMGDQAQNGSEFVLHDDSKKEWLDWAPKIPIQPDDTDRGKTDATLPRAPETVHSAVGSQ